MTTYPAFELINEWSLQAEPIDDFQKIADYVRFFAPRIDLEYEPTRGPHRLFLDRLTEWIGNVSSVEDKQTLIRMIPKILYVGVSEFESLYRSALNEQIVRWLVDLLGLSLDDPALQNGIQRAIKRSWICPVSDSLRINSFYKANRLSGREERPDWKSLRAFADPDQVRTFMASTGIERVVLVEDFVGTGQQVKHTLEYAITTCRDKPLLFIPLLICEGGLKVCRKLEKRHSNFRVSPVVIVPDRFFIKQASNGEELHDAILALAKKHNNRIRRRNSGPLGFGSVGAMVILNSNCPNNSLPLLHRTKAEWHPLFPRIARNT